MKFSFPSYKQNLYRMMRNQWKVLRKKKVLSTPAEKVIEDPSSGVMEANEFVSSKKHYNFDFSSIVGLAPKEIPKDEKHPLYKNNLCYTYRDHSVLLEGLNQALVLTNTVQLNADSLPEQFQKLVDKVQLPNQDKLVKRSIRTSCLYDAEQKKLPVRKDPERPAWNFPRDYGITESRKNRMLSSRLLHLCEMSSPDLAARRALIPNAPLTVPTAYEGDIVMFQLRADLLLAADSPLPALVDPADTESIDLPELTVSHPLISLEEENFYELKDVFPLKQDTRLSHTHTIIVHYNSTEVQNIFETPVTLDQTVSRSLLKAYTVAVAQARYNYGTAVKDVPQPIVVQCVQTDGRCFHFSMFQLNSVDSSSRRHNVFWNLPPLDLYDDCSYIQAVPRLLGYNPQVFKYLLAFYNNT